MKKCASCDMPIDPERIFCDSCGKYALGNNTVSIDCEIHEKQKAIGICIVCSKPLCTACAVEVEGNLFCSDSDHQKIFRDWQRVYRLDSEFEADVITCNLAQAGFLTRCFSLHDYAMTSWLKENRVLLFVLKSDLEHVQKLLQEWNYFN